MSFRYASLIRQTEITERWNLLLSLRVLAPSQTLNRLRAGLDRPAYNSGYPCAWHTGKIVMIDLDCFSRLPAAWPLASNRQTSFHTSADILHGVREVGREGRTVWQTAPPNCPPTGVFRVHRVPFHENICPVIKELAKGAWFGTRRSVVRIHSPRPILSITYIRRYSRFQYH